MAGVAEVAADLLEEITGDRFACACEGFTMQREGLVELPRLQGRSREPELGAPASRQRSYAAHGFHCCFLASALAMNSNIPAKRVFQVRIKFYGFPQSAFDQRLVASTMMDFCEIVQEQAVLSVFLNRL